MIARAWIATIVATTFLSGCCATHSTRANETRMAQIESRLEPAPTAAPQDVASEPIALAGTYEEGFHAGESDANAATVAGWGILGFLTAPILLICLIVAIGGGSSDSFGDGPLGSHVGVEPGDAAARTPEYLVGYDGGYNRRLEQRRNHAFTAGLITGLLVIAGAVVYGAVDEKRREEAEEAGGQHATAGGRRGVTILEF